MLDHMILTVSNVERSLAFHEAALKPLNIKFFLPYEGEGDHPDLWGFGDGKRAFFWIKQGKPDPTSIHWGFMAENNGKVDVLVYGMPVRHDDVTCLGMNANHKGRVCFRRVARYNLEPFVHT